MFKDLYKNQNSPTGITSIVILLVAVSVTGKSNKVIICSKNNEICKEVLVGNSIPYSEPGQETAPKPLCLYLSYYDKVDDTATLNITWMQKRMDLRKVTGYYISRTGYEDTERVKFHLDSAKIIEKKSDDVHITFQYHGFDIVSGEQNAITLRSLPMYQKNDRNYELKAGIDGTERYTQEEWLQKSTPSCPGRIKEAEKDLIDNISPTNGSNKRKNNITENYKTILNKNDMFVNNFIPVADEPMVPIRVTVIACVFSMLGTIITIILIVFIYYICSKAIESAHNRKYNRKRAIKNSRNDKKPKILIVTSMMDNDNTARRSTQKKVLSFASALYDCSDFDVNCNLWMTQEIAKKGTVFWSHSVINDYDKIIMLCNPFTVTVLKQFIETDIWSNNTQSQSDPSVQVAYSFTKNASYSKSTAIIVCIEKEEHECLKDVTLSWMNDCKKFCLTHQIEPFLNALDKGKGKYKNPALQSRLRKIISQKIQKSNSDTVSNARNLSTPTKLSLLNENSASGNKRNKTDENVSNSNYQTEVLITRTQGEVQYDSMYSSRCNSHSTESISSIDDEDTGFNENVIKSITSNPKTTGARRKE